MSLHSSEERCGTTCSLCHRGRDRNHSSNRQVFLQVSSVSAVAVRLVTMKWHLHSMARCFPSIWQAFKLQVFSKTVGFRSSLTLRPYIISHTTPKWFHYTVKYGAIARPLPPPNHPHTCSCTHPLPALSPTACTLMAAFDAAHSHPTQYTYTFV